MKRLPLLPTIVVVLAVAAMLALGGWQLQRRAEKEALIARFAAQAGKPVMALPAFPTEDALFRRVSVRCLDTANWTSGAGRTTGGISGWRHIAECRTGAEGPGVRVDLGISTDPTFRPRWQGGDVTGTLTQAPGGSPAIARLFGRESAPAQLIVAETPAPGLQPSQQPDPQALPNNHLGYAIQWFAFALIAAIIYPLALRRRRSAA